MNDVIMKSESNNNNDKHMEYSENISNPILLFDGVCNLCNGYVQFVLERDNSERLRFGSLQSEAAGELLKQNDLPTDYTDSLVLIEGSDYYTESSAVLRICTYLGGVYRLFSAFSVVPKFIRDAIYRFIAERRYEWFGKRKQCMVPPPGVQSRFIDCIKADDDN
jgi:predicted DCC family thiol-disulfide oxidoreductase YuxK